MSATCELCPEIERLGYSPPGVYHCDDCHRSWKGLSTAHCTVCHETFTSDTGFDLHLSADGCKAPDTARRRNGVALYRRIERFGGPAWALMAVVVQSPYATRKGA